MENWNGPLFLCVYPPLLDSHIPRMSLPQGSLDDLKSPSARLCVGRVVEVGTGAVELIHNI